MTKDYYKKKAEQLLENLETYKISVEIMRELENCGALSLRKAKTAHIKREHYENLIKAADRAMSLLTPTERRIIDELYFRKDEHSFFDVCEICAMEKSSIYRHRDKALNKIGKAIFGLR